MSASNLLATSFLVIALVISSLVIPRPYELALLAKIVEINFKPAPNDRQKFVDWWSVRALDLSKKNHQGRHNLALKYTALPH